MSNIKKSIKYFDQTELFGFFHWAYYYFTKYVKDISQFTPQEITAKKSVLDTIASTIKTYFLDGKKHEVDVVMKTIYQEAHKKQLDINKTLIEAQKVFSIEDKTKDISKLR